MQIDDPIFERDLIAFHLGRVREKHGLKSPSDQPDYHFAESHWRYHFHILAAQRPSAEVHAMMFAHLVELIRLCGPIGKPPVNREAGLEAILRQMDQRIAWLERDAPDFRAVALRSALKAVREL